MKIVTLDNASATQTEHPGRTTVRTFVQTIIPSLGLFVLAVPAIVDVIVDETSKHGVTIPPELYAILAGLSVACAVIAAVVARVMAIPQVEKLLRGTGLSAAPSEPPGNWDDADSEDVDYEARH